MQWPCACTRGLPLPSQYETSLLVPEIACEHWQWAHPMQVPPEVNVPGHSRPKYAYPPAAHCVLHDSAPAREIATLPYGRTQPEGQARQSSIVDGDSGGGGKSGGGAGGGEGKGGGMASRSPQSMQSVPSSHKEKSEPAPPSSQTPSLANMACAPQEVRQSFSHKGGWTKSAPEAHPKCRVKAPAALL